MDFEPDPTDIPVYPFSILRLSIVTSEDVTELSIPTNPELLFLYNILTFEMVTFPTGTNPVIEIASLILSNLQFTIEILSDNTLSEVSP